MTVETERGLLLDALALLKDTPDFALRQDVRRTSYALCARIEAFLTTAANPAATEDVLREVRDRWRSEPGVRVDDGARVEIDAQGLWVGAWLRAGTPIVPVDTLAYEKALASLPVLAREVFLLNRRDGLGYHAIGRTLGLSAVQVEREFAAALSGLYRRVSRLEARS